MVAVSAVFILIADLPPTTSRIGLFIGLALILLTLSIPVASLIVSGSLMVSSFRFTQRHAPCLIAWALHIDRTLIIFLFAIVFLVSMLQDARIKSDLVLDCRHLGDRFDVATFGEVRMTTRGLLSCVSVPRRGGSSRKMIELYAARIRPSPG